MLLSEIKTRYELANLLGIEVSELTYVLYIEKVDNLYTTFSIPKKSGGYREINAPNKKLKFIQKQLKYVLESCITEIYTDHMLNNNVSHAFQKNKSIMTNAHKHRKKKYVINVDLESFFNSFNFGRVRGFFINNRYWQLSPDISTLIAQITCYKGALPQGAPTSPIITNLICNIMDWHLTKLSKKYKLLYSRYADDLTFSTNDKKIIDCYSQFYKDLEAEIQKSGFCINKTKTRFTNYRNRQEVTGLTVNKKIAVSKTFCHNTHAMAHSLYRKGEFFIDGETGTLNQLSGRFSFIHQVDKYNNVKFPDGRKHSVQCLTHREKKYQEFLFYRLFCANDKPLLITEGKTDNLYLRAALNSIGSSHPILYNNNSGVIDYNVRFFNRNSNMDYYFGCKKDGGDTLKNIASLYGHCNSSYKLPNYYESLIKKYNISPVYPVIILLDNELSDTKDSPIIHMKLNESARASLSKNLFYNLCGNLYIQVIPLVQGKTKCEIEDLFYDIDNLIIDGRKLDRNGKRDKNIYYYKEQLSQYIYHNKDQFDFSEFNKVLDTWEKIIIDYNSKKTTIN